MHVVLCKSETVGDDSASSLLLQVDVTKCVVNTDASFRSHWLVTATCTFGHYLKAVVLYLLRDKWKTDQHCAPPAPLHWSIHCFGICLHSFALSLYWWTLVPSQTMDSPSFFRFLVSIYYYIQLHSILAHIWCECIKSPTVNVCNFLFFHKQQNWLFGGFGCPQWWKC